ncbi:MAG: ABC transporter permease [Hyphomicrobiales bacterium]|nr:ABC transporter permease [Hyphomicrobiales bacterium]
MVKKILLSPAVEKERQSGQKILNTIKRLRNYGYVGDSNASIIPRHSIAGNALIIVIMIMTFLASLTIGATNAINKTASGWQSDVSREVTIQIRPSDEVEMDKAERDASRIALSYDGVTKVVALNDKAVSRLLEPWLGKNLKLNELPVPGLLTVSLDGDQLPDFASMRRELEQSVPGATLDDHRAWVGRLNAMAWTMVALGFAIFLLVMGATILIVVFTTRGAMVGNQEIVEVLHFVGADSAFIARQFQHHFMILGFFGAASGGVLAIIIFATLAFWSSQSLVTPQTEQINFLFGAFSVGLRGYFGMVAVVLLVAALTALTSRITVVRHVWNLEKNKAPLSG